MSIVEEAYYLVEVMVFVSVFPRRRFGILARMMTSHHDVIRS
jgi:hypothetical protein